MLATWGVEDFKSIGSACAQLSKGHITVLTGKNSIGKSSLLQSMLFACQSVDERRISINGALVRLGSPEDVIRHGKKACALSFDYHSRYAFADNNRGLAHIKVLLEPLEQMQSSAPRLRITEATISENADTLASDGRTGAIVAYCTTERMRPDDRLQCERMLNASSDHDILRVREAFGKPQTRTYVAFKGFKAVAIITHKDKAWMQQRVDEIFASLFPDEKRGGIRIYQRMLFESLWEYGHKRDIDDIAVLRDFIYEYRRRRSAGDLKALKTVVRRVLDERAKDSFIMRDIGRMHGSAHQDIFASVELDEIDALVRYLDEGNRSLESRMNSIRYVGPLRDEPRAFSDSWQVPALHCPVGRRGEHTAAVLESYHGIKREFGLPDEGFSSDTVTIGEAVAAWSRYIGVADEVISSNLQKLGTGIRVKSLRGTHDLTAVGVGASQVVPVLLAVLTAKEGDALLLEQPEIHLHPSAQACLADFILYARPDLTFVIETHSEALLTRMRRRVAEESALNSNVRNSGSLGQSRKLGDRISILFFEEAGESASSNEVPPVLTRKLEINEFGNLTEWPKGFLDAVQDDSIAIMMIAAKGGPQ